MKLSLVAFLFFLSSSVAGQVISDFSAPTEVCRQQNVKFVNSSTEDADHFEWDFCSMDIESFKDQSDVTSIAGLSFGFGYKLVEDQGSWFGFVTSTNSHSLLRLDFGDKPTNVPAITNLGNVGGNLLFPEGLDVIKENDEWRVFIGSLESGHGITRIDFGSSLLNNPLNSQRLGTFGFVTRFRNVKCIKKDGNYYLILPGYNTNSIIIINYRDSFDNSISSADKIDSGPLTGLVNPVGLDIVKLDSDDYVALVTSYNGNSITVLNYGNDILSVPLVDSTYNFSGINKPYNIKILREGLVYYAAVSNEAVPLRILNFNNLHGSNAPSEVSYDAVFPIGGGIDFFRFKGQAHLQSTGIYDNKFRDITFEESCGDSVSFLQSDSLAVVSYSTSGTKQIELISKNSHSEEVAIATKQINVLSLTAPDIDFITNGNCTTGNVEFSPSNISGNITSYNWDFGDMTSHSVDETPVHNYTASGEYTIILEVVANNACKNFTSAQVKVFPPPVAAFSLPSGQLCTNSEISIINNTTDEYDGLLTYAWFVNNGLEVNSIDLSYTFESVGSSEIKLVASIPGCSDDEIQEAIVFEGPELSFTSTGVCEKDTVFFFSQVSDPVIVYQWSFGDESFSDQENPEHIFNTPGNFIVSLTAVTESGCNSVVTNNLMIEPEPGTDFIVDFASTYCSDTPLTFTSSFTNGGSEIESMEWDFGDSSEIASDEIVQHAFSNAGTYEVALTARNYAGCSKSMKKSVLIYQTPSVDFLATTSCVGMPVNFVGSSSDEGNSWQWTIGDKTYRSDTLTHTFRTPGAHPVILKVEALNGCEASVIKNIFVPVPLEADFSIYKNCLNEKTVFTDLTAGDDEIAEWQWKIDDGVEIAGNPLEFEFEEAGEHTVEMEVVAVSGCSYISSKTFSIVPAPEAGFTVSSDIGSPPFPVTFINRSKESTHFNWNFADGSTSEEESPEHIFENTGEYNVLLMASNEQGCQDIFSKVITISPPFPDVSIVAVTTSENPDKTMKIMITVQNEGNTILTNLPIKIDISGALDVREIIAGPMMPLSRVNLTLGYGLKITDNISFLCATAELENDRVPESNRNCVEFQQDVIFLPGYPNPVKEYLTVEWIATSEQNITVSLFNSLSVKVWEYEFSSKKGLNQKIIPVESLQKGVYMLVLEALGVKTKQRILLSR